MIAHRMKNVAPFYVMDLLARAKELETEGKSVIHMEVGEPDFITAQPIIDAGKKALDDGMTGYTPAKGIPELRKAIAENYKEKYGVSLDPERIIVTPGASGALQMIMTILINPGEEVLMTDPGYPCNKNFVELVSGIPVSLAVGPETNFQLSAEQVAKEWSEKTKAVIVATPSNPTGTLLSREELTDIYAVCKEKGGHLLVDEIYQGLVYGTESFTALDCLDGVFVINSFSKYFGMTGWRLGWLVAPEKYIEPLDILAQNIFLSCSAPAQYAALKALSSDCRSIFEKRKNEFLLRRDFLVESLGNLGFGIPVVPQGAFYLYADCSKLTNDSFAFAYALLEAEGVAITPGKDFGCNNPEKFVRFAYTTKIEKMKEGMSRISRYLGRQPQV